MRRNLVTAGLATALFLVLAAGFLAIIGQPPVATLLDLVLYAFGDTYSLSESLVKAIPILFCALAVIVPARLGLISVGADGQLYLGALFGTAMVLWMPAAPGAILMPAMLLAGAVGGAALSLVAGGLRARFGVNETITTLLLNYVGVLLVNFVVYGPWKDPANLGWPATIEFPPGATVPGLFGTRAHWGLALAIGLAVVLHVVFASGRLGLRLRVLRENERVGRMAGLSFARMVLLTMAVGGGVAGLAGIIETSAVQGRLQPGLSLGYGLTGFLVAWLSGHSFLLAVPLSILIGGLIAAGDTLQLFAKVPASSMTILLGLLFAAMLAAAGIVKKRRGDA
ncbi:MAG: ABC transporter permease [Rhizobiales bacterium]|nr:ABC transporter permease [Hyphomicrobiales bacterium]